MLFSLFSCSYTVSAHSFFCELMDSTDFVSVPKDAEHVFIHYTSADESTKEDALIIDSITVEPVPAWSVRYKPTLNGEIGNTTMGMRIVVSREKGHAKITFIPIVDVTIDKFLIYSYQMSLAAHEGEFEHYVDISLCWKNVFTPYAADLVGSTQNISKMKKLATGFFYEKMNQTRVFWDESGRHNINRLGFRNTTKQAVIDDYRLKAYGEIYPYHYESGMVVEIIDETKRFDRES